MDLFFALSGFLIAGILLDTKGAPFFLRGFYLLRISRICTSLSCCSAGQYLGVASIPATWPAALYAFMIPALLSVALAALSWRVFERALVRTGHRLSAQHSQEAVTL